MASTIPFATTVGLAQAFLRFPTLTIGVGGEPAFTCANLVAQQITGPPFDWPWNRFKANFLLTQGIQDTTVNNLSNIGYFEIASVQPAAIITNTALTGNVATYTAVNKFVAGNLVTVTGSTNGGSVFNITNLPILASPAPTPTQFSVSINHTNVASAADTGTALSGSTFSLQLKNEALTEAYGAEQDRPHDMSWQVDNDNGTIVFRTLPVADQTYNVVLTWQGAPPQFTTLNQTWAPIPDYLQYIYTYGFLSLMLDYFEGPGAGAEYRRLFVASLLARQEGIDEQDKAVWLGTWYPNLEVDIAKRARAQQGETARGI